MHSCLYVGRVRHRRFFPRRHCFDYRVFYSYLDLDELEQIFTKRWFWSHRKPTLAWFKRSDYLGPSTIPLRQAVAEKVKAATGTSPRGPIRVLTHLRYFGFVFNPVSFYYCFDELDRYVETIVAEITNTPWGERFSYVLSSADQLSKSQYMCFGFQKKFHVSPFMPMDVNYNWSFGVPDETLNVYMSNFQHQRKIFDATLQLKRKPFDSKNSAAVLVQYPFITIKIVAAIYWQALKLVLKRTPVFTHPSKTKISNSGGTNTVKSK